MTSHAVGEASPRPLLTLGRVDRLRVQVGYRGSPDGAAYEQFLLDLAVPEADSPAAREAFSEGPVLALLEPVLYTHGDAARHYSIHQHRWHTSWGASPGSLEIGLLVTTGTATAPSEDGVTRAFRDLLALAGPQDSTPTSRDAAIRKARSSAATAFALDPDALSLSTEQHHPAENSWTVGLRATTGDEYAVVVGLVDGYAGAVRVLHQRPTEVTASVGSD
jgi:hypothetical protein